MPYAVVFSEECEAVSPSAKARVLERLREIGEAVERMSENSALMSSMARSRMEIAVDDWWFYYQVQPLQRRMIVLHAVPLRG